MSKPKSTKQPPKEMSLGTRRWVASIQEAIRVYNTYVKPAEEAAQQKKEAA